eukprot:TRINITY_DN1776_c0_g1_i5.p1 TRINITY_DN1776_c0_g1~~TRINITY_DN1776_c0_g1_i5.p1  ORF type:complete len:192 (-),score=41.75 TRINITY_DN1776_c0_g1_i5:39-614(-)
MCIRDRYQRRVHGNYLIFSKEKIKVNLMNKTLLLIAIILGCYVTSATQNKLRGLVSDTWEQEIATIESFVSGTRNLEEAQQLKLRPLEIYEIDEAVEYFRLRDWSVKQSESLSYRLYKQFKFNDFKEAFFKFMHNTAVLAETMQHHPDWQNVYNSVQITLETHDVGGVSINDIILAALIEKNSSKTEPKNE